MTGRPLRTTVRRGAEDAVRSRVPFVAGSLSGGYLGETVDTGPGRLAEEHREDWRKLCRLASEGRRVYTLWSYGTPHRLRAGRGGRRLPGPVQPDHDAAPGGRSPGPRRRGSAVRRPELVDLVPSRHAVDVIRRRGVSWTEVEETVRHAATSYASRGCTVFRRGALSVVVADAATVGVGVVVTVLLASQARWTDEDVRLRRVGRSAAS